MPAAFAASRIEVPAGTDTFRPSMVRLTRSGIHEQILRGACPEERQRRRAQDDSRHATAGTKCTFFFLISASKSPRNFLMADTTGTAHESLSTQMVLPVMFSAISSS